MTVLEKGVSYLKQWMIYFKAKYHSSLACQAIDQSAQLYLCLGSNDNRQVFFCYRLQFCSLASDI